MPQPLSKELTRVVKETEIGIPIEKALESMVQRFPLTDLELLITAIILQKQTGGNLAEILDNIAETIRDRLALKREVKTITAQGILSGWIIALIPVFITLILMVLNPSYIMILFTDRLGIFMLILAALSELMGVIIIKKVINIEY
jgi:tight adherence protein B